MPVDYRVWGAMILLQSYHFAVCYCSWWMYLKTVWMYWVSYKQLTFIYETFELLVKSYAKFDLLFVNIQHLTACSLEKLKFKVYTAISVEP